MKRIKRILVTLLAVTLLMTSLTGCDDYREQVAEVFEKVKTVFSGEQTVTGDPVVSEPVPTEPVPTEPEPTAEPGRDVIEDTKVVLEYTLSEEDIAELQKMIDAMHK